MKVIYREPTEVEMALALIDTAEVALAEAKRLLTDVGWGETLDVV